MRIPDKKESFVHFSVAKAQQMDQPPIDLLLLLELKMMRSTYMLPHSFLIMIMLFTWVAAAL